MNIIRTLFRRMEWLRSTLPHFVVASDQYFALTSVHEKALCKVDATVAHN